MTATAYDEIPYTSKVLGDTHPYKLATLATFFGLESPSIESCRVLEIGCASGTNIIAMAEAFPLAQFVGIDFSARQINAALETARLIGLENIVLKQMDIMDVDPDFGTFDYIIAHGIYSWIPDAVQDKLLQICHDNLSPNGVAYVSYNTYPGWHTHGLVRQMMLYHIHQFTGPAKQIEQAKAMMKFLVEATEELASKPGNEQKFYNEALKSTLDILLRTNDDAYLFHEYLEDNNTPVFFYQFMERAEKHQLKYLAEVSLSTMLAANFPPAIIEKLKLFGHDIVRQEQYMDFLRNRPFRRTLLCHQHQTINRLINPTPVFRLHILANIRPASPQQDINTEVNEKFINATGKELFTSAVPALKACFISLSSAYPGSLSFDELMETIREMMSSQGLVQQADAWTATRDSVANFLFKLYLHGHIELSPAPFRAIPTVSEYPVASRLARLQAQQGNPFLANAHFDNSTATPLGNFLLPLLDGQHNREALVEATAAALEQGRLQFQGQPRAMTKEQYQASLSLMVDNTLKSLANLALLVQ